MNTFEPEINEITRKNDQMMINYDTQEFQVKNGCSAPAINIAMNVECHLKQHYLLEFSTQNLKILLHARNHSILFECFLLKVSKF